MTAGTKDKRGITSQLVTVKDLNPQNLYNSIRYDSRIAIGNFTFTDKSLQLGHLKVIFLIQQDDLFYFTSY